MPKIAPNTDRTFLLNDEPYQRGAYDVTPKRGLSNNPNIEIIYLGANGTNRASLTDAKLSDWTDENDASFADVQAFYDYIEPFFFRNTVGGGGGGTPYTQVEFRGDLPIDVGTPVVGTVYLVEKPTTILGVYTTYQSGLYIRDNNTGALSDWRRLNVKVKFTDGEFGIVKASNQSVQARYDLSLLLTSHVYQHQNKSGVIAHLDDVSNKVIAGGTYTPSNAPFIKNTLIEDSGWLMLALTDTSDKPAPQPIGNPFYLFDDVLNDNSQNASQIITGQRYTSEYGAYLTGYKLETVVGNNYSVYSVQDPLGAKIINEVISFTETTTGSKEFGVGNIIIPANTTFDMILVIREPDPSPTTFNGDWNYIRTGNLTIPVAGQITQSNTSSGILQVSKTDGNAVDRSADLALLDVGDIINVEDVSWAIQNIADQGTYINFSVAPAVRLNADGSKNFVFETVVATPITYAENVDYWIADPNISGLFVVDDSYDNISVNNTQYNIDIQVQKASISSDWLFQAYSSVGGSASGSGVTEAPADGSLYSRNGETEVWSKNYGVIETFDLSAKENNQNANSGEFQGIFKIIQAGYYDRFVTQTNNLNVGANQSWQLRCALYNFSDGTLISQGSIELTDTQENTWTIILDTPFNIYEPKGVHCVVGVNDNIGGGSVQITRMNANALNEDTVAFQFNQSSGLLPSTLPVVSSTNNVRFQIYYGAS